MCCDCNICKAIKISLTIILIICLVILIVIQTNNMPQSKDILTAVARPGDNTQLGFTTIKFSQNQIVEGNAISHVEGSDEILINESGIYQISYQIFGQEERNETFNFVAVLSVNNQQLEDTLNESPVITDFLNNRMTLTSTVILRLNAGDVLKLEGISIEDIVYSRARIDFEKIG